MSVQRGGGVGGVSDAFSLWTWLMLFPCLSSSLAWLNLSSSQLDGYATLRYYTARLLSRSQLPSPTNFLNNI